MRTISLLLVSAFALSGCVDGLGADGTDEGPPPDPLAGLPKLHGWILDNVAAPVPNVEVQASGGNAVMTATTDAEGFYGIDGMPEGTAIIITARADGFITQSKQATIQPGAGVQLNFTLEREVTKVAYHDTLGPFQGFIECQQVTETSESRTVENCGSGNNDNKWQITVQKDFAGGVIEIEWNPNTDGSRYMRGSVECATPAACGDNIEPFTYAIGESRLRVEIGSLVADKYFRDGGIMLLTVDVDPAIDDQEADQGTAVAASQSFEAIASMFYHEPPPSGYKYDD